MTGVETAHRLEPELMRAREAGVAGGADVEEMQHVVAHVDPVATRPANQSNESSTGAPPGPA